MSKLAAAILLSTATGALAYSDQDTDVDAFLQEYSDCAWQADEPNPATGSNGRVYCAPGTFIYYNKPLKDSNGVELDSRLSVNLQGASLEGISFTADFDIPGHAMPGTIEMSHANLAGARFGKANWGGVYVNYANLNGADLSDITGVFFGEEADLSNADLSYASLYEDDSTFSNAKINSNTNFDGAQLLDAATGDRTPLFPFIVLSSSSSSSSLADADCADLQSAYIGKMNAGECQCAN